MASKKKSFIESRGFKTLLKYLYGFGAAVVILGALFKIMHWPGANAMLIAGMGVEVLIFFVSAFEPLHEELDWTRVYPQLGEDDDSTFIPLPDEDSGLSTEDALDLTSRKMEKINLSPDIFDALSGSIEGLKSNVDKLSDLQDASVATNEYASSVRQATNQMSQLNEGYTSTVSAMNDLSNSVGGAAEQANAYHAEVQRVTSNLASLSAVYEMELQETQNHVASISKFYGSIGGAMDSIVAASKDAEIYQQEVAKLTQNISALNRVYGGMLSAMGGGNA